MSLVRAIIKLKEHGVAIDIIDNIVKRVNFEDVQYAQKIKELYNQMIYNNLTWGRISNKSLTQFSCPICKAFTHIDKIGICDSENCDKMVCPSCSIKPHCFQAGNCFVHSCSTECLKQFLIENQLTRLKFTLNYCDCGAVMNCSDCAQENNIADHLVNGECPNAV